MKLDDYVTLGRSGLRVLDDAATAESRPAPVPVGRCQPTGTGTSSINGISRDVASW